LFTNLRLYETIESIIDRLYLDDNLYVVPVYKDVFRKLIFIAT